MTAVGSISEIICTGSVSSVGIGSSVEQVRAALGPEIVADGKKKSIRLDYGMLELNFYSNICESFSVQVHRVAAHPDVGTVGVLPAGRRADFSAVSLEDLRDALLRQCSLRLEELKPQGGYRCYQVVGRHVNIFAVSDEEFGLESLAVGDIWSISVAGAG